MHDLNDFVVENGVLKKYVGKSRDVRIPDGVTNIEKYAFEFCKSIGEIIIPDSVKRIRKDTFYECPFLHIRTNNLSCLYKDDKKWQYLNFLKILMNMRIRQRKDISNISKKHGKIYR